MVLLPKLFDMFNGIQRWFLDLLQNLAPLIGFWVKQIVENSRYATDSNFVVNSYF